MQRYAIEWAEALREMAELDAEILLPGHGLPILGADRIRLALTESATLLEHLHHETIRMMNEGATLDEIVNTVRAPDGLLERPYLGPIYDEPEFVVRNVWRLFGGWYDGDPSHLKPAPAPRSRRRSRTSPAAPSALASARRRARRGRRAPARGATGGARGPGRAGSAPLHGARADVYRRGSRRGVDHGEGRVLLGRGGVGAAP